MRAGQQRGRALERTCSSLSLVSCVTSFSSCSEVSGASLRAARTSVCACAFVAACSASPSAADSSAAFARPPSSVICFACSAIVASAFAKAFSFAASFAKVAATPSAALYVMSSLSSFVDSS